jgi:hypothetical protein
MIATRDSLPPRPTAERHVGRDNASRTKAIISTRSASSSHSRIRRRLFNFGSTR